MIVAALRVPLTVTWLTVYRQLPEIHLKSSEINALTNKRKHVESSGWMLTPLDFINRELRSWCSQDSQDSQESSRCGSVIYQIQNLMWTDVESTPKIIRVDVANWPCGYNLTMGMLVTSGIFCTCVKTHWCLKPVHWGRVCCTMSVQERNSFASERDCQLQGELLCVVNSFSEMGSVQESNTPGQQSWSSSGPDTNSNRALMQWEVISFQNKVKLIS